MQEATARDFVADAFAHCKFIGYVDAAMPLFEKAGIAEADLDEGIIALAAMKDAQPSSASLASCVSGPASPSLR